MYEYVSERKMSILSVTLAPADEDTAAEISVLSQGNT
jgi:hypothetical protein